MARPKEFDEQQVLRDAVDVFWRKGYKATSIQDLVGATGLAEGSLYNTFGGKRQLFLRAFAKYRARMEKYLLAIQQSDEPLEAIAELFDKIATGLSRQRDFRGCLVTNTTIELAPHDEQVRAELQASYKEMEAAFRQALRRAQRQQQLAESANTRALARFLLQSLEGMRVMAKADVGARALRDMADVSLSVLTADPPPRRQGRRPGRRARTRPSV